MNPNTSEDPFGDRPLRRRTTKVIRVAEDGRVISSAPVSSLFLGMQDSVQLFQDRYRKPAEGQK